MANATSTDSYPYTLNARYSTTGNGREAGIFTRRIGQAGRSNVWAWAFYARVNQEYCLDFIGRMRVEDADIRIALDTRKDRRALMFGALMSVSEFTDWKDWIATGGAA